MNSAALAGKELSTSASRVPRGLNERRSARPCAPRAAPAVKAILGLERVFGKKEAKGSAHLFGGKTGEALATEVKETDAKYILQTYKRTEQVFVSGKGSYLVNASGKEFLDFSGGIAVNVFGHSDPGWAKAVADSAAVLAHTSNLYHTVPGPALAKLLVESSGFADRAFFCNSGTEANEAAIKFARKYQRVKWEAEHASASAEHVGSGPASEFLAFSNCFHGRTMGALALTWKEGYRAPFMPVMPGASFAEYGNLEDAKSKIVKGRTAAVFVEPVQGEGGIYTAQRDFLAGLRAACDAAGALLVYDEVQCGLGRTGKLWGYMQTGVQPDILTAAKPLAGGLPIGAVLLREKVAAAMQPGDHGSTFAGGPLVAGVAHYCVERVMQRDFLQNVVVRGDELRATLRDLLKGNPNVVEVRGIGLLVGIQMKASVTPVVEEARKRGLLIITAGAGDIVRLVPPLTITSEDVQKAAALLADSINAVAK